MTGEQFVKLCYEEKKTILAEWTFYYHKVSDFYTNQYNRQNQGHSHCDYFFFFSHHK